MSIHHSQQKVFHLSRVISNLNPLVISNLLPVLLYLLPGELDVSNIEKDGHFLQEGISLDLDDGFDACESVPLASHVGDEGKVGSGILDDLLHLLLVEPVDELLVGVEVDQDGRVLNDIEVFIDKGTLEELFVVNPYYEVGNTLRIL